MEILLEFEADVNVENFHKATPLHIAAISGHIHIAKTLLENGAKTESRTEVLDTPLMAAVRRNDLPMARLLVAFGADPTVVRWNGDSLLSLCSQRATFAYLLSLGLGPA